MNVVYLFFLNFLMYLVILKSTSFLARERGKVLVLSAFVGASFSLYKNFVPLSKFGNITSFLGMCVLFVCLSFNFVTFSKFFQIYCCQLCSFLFYAGLCYFLLNYLEINSLILIFSSIIIVCYSVEMVLKISHRRKMVSNFCFDIQIENDEKILSCKAFLDSGNLLFDPVTENPVCLINLSAFSKLFEINSAQEILSGRICKKMKFAHQIYFQTLNSKNKILVFQVDKITVGQKKFQNATLGLCLENFDNAFGSDVILHNFYAI